MRFFLSSYQIGDPEKLKSLLTENHHALYIANALDRYGNSERVQTHNQTGKKQLEAIGLSVEFLDLREYFGKQEELLQKLSSAGLIWVSGGNVFDLRIAMKLSGFDEVIHELAQTDIVYGASSAGVCVLSPTLDGYQIVDDAENNPYREKTLWEGLGLISWQFAPHYQSSHNESADVEKEIDYHKAHGREYRALRDGEVIVVR